MTILIAKPVEEYIVDTFHDTRLSEVVKKVKKSEVNSGRTKCNQAKTSQVRGSLSLCEPRDQSEPQSLSKDAGKI
jgi:hypothetical protein